MDKNSCECKTCISACKTKPGWLKPGEAEKIAKHLNLSLQDLFDKYLSVDWYHSNNKDYYILSPVAKNNIPGEMFPYNPKGECIFFKDGRCEIHSVSPFECKEYYHEDTMDDLLERHKEVAESWEGKDEYLSNLLGHYPHPLEAESFNDKFGIW